MVVMTRPWQASPERHLSNHSGENSCVKRYPHELAIRSPFHRGVDVQPGVMWAVARAGGLGGEVVAVVSVDLDILPVRSGRACGYRRVLPVGAFRELLP